MTFVGIQALADLLHETAVEKGFWDVEDALDKHVAKWRGELGEVIQADRMGMMYEVERDGAKPEGVAAELADFVMMALDMYAQQKTPLVSVLEEVEYNDALVKNIENSSLVTLVNTLYAASVDLTRANVDQVVKKAIALTIRAPRIWLEHRGYDLWELIRQKMAYNASRPKLHGRAY